MSSRSDLPGCTSSVSVPPTDHRMPRFHSARRRWLRLLAGAALPATLLGTQLLPLHSTPVVHASAAAFALTTSLGTVTGDSGLGDAALDELASSQDGLTTAGAPRVTSRVVRVAVDAANVRTGPSTSFASMTKLASASKVTLLSYHNDWYQVRLDSGREGWMSAEVLVISSGATDGLVAAKDIPTTDTTSRATTNDSGVNVRKGPGTTYASVGKLAKSVAVTILSQQSGWYKISSGGVTGWVSEQFLRVPTKAANEAAPAATRELIGYTASDGSRLRMGPGSAYGELMKIDENVKLTLVARHGDWYKVQTPRGTTGWMSSDLLSINPDVISRVPSTNTFPALPKPTPARPVAAAPSGKSGTAARAALRIVGRPYVWGAAGPRAFDCSGVLVYAYRQVGVYLPHKASAMFSSRYGSVIRRMGDLRAGDMLFFRNTAGYGITHAAIYVGGGMMVSANSPRSGVQYQSIYSSYWQRHWAGAIRPYAR